jgi:hypothetical protein
VIDDFEAVLCGVSDKDPTCLWVECGVVEVAVQAAWYGDDAMRFQGHVVL